MQYDVEVAEARYGMLCVCNVYVMEGMEGNDLLSHVGNHPAYY